MNILMAASDNRKYSGAFLCMVKLASLLQDTYHQNVTVLLPCKGDGQQLLDENHIPHVTVQSYSWIIPQDKLHDPVTVFKMVAKRFLTSFAPRKIEKIIKEKQIDIIHINTTWTYAAAVAAYKSGTPLVWHIREFLEEDQGMQIWHREMGYELLKKSDMAVCVSHSVYEKYAPIIGEDRVTVIYDGLDRSKFYNPEHTIFKEDMVNIVCVGILYEHKRQWMAIEACIKLYEKGYKNIRLQVVGTSDDDAYIESLNKLIEENSAESYIEMCGASDNTPEYYNAADISLVCSRSEAFGRVTVESMMAGDLVIGADSMGTKELIDPDVTGLLYQVDSVDDLVTKLEYALIHKEEMRALAQNGRDYMARNMTAAINAEKINDMYKEVLGKRKALP